MEGECEYDHEQTLFIYSDASMTTRTSVVIALTTVRLLLSYRPPSGGRGLITHYGMPLEFITSCGAHMRGGGSQHQCHLYRVLRPAPIPPPAEQTTTPPELQSACSAAML